MTPTFKIACLITLIAGYALAQTPVVPGSPVDGSTPPSLAQGAPAGTYALNGFETVNLFNGGLNFILPLVQLKGRGGSEIPLVLPIERKWIVSVADDNGAVIRYPLSQDETNFAATLRGYRNPGRLLFRETGRNLAACGGGPNSFMYKETLTRITFQRGDGTEMEFVDAKTGGYPQITDPIDNGSTGLPPSCQSVATQSRGRVWVTRDGSFATLVLGSDLTDGTSYNNAPPVTSGGGGDAFLFLKDGSRYKFTNLSLKQIRDRNGNLTDFDYDIYSRLTRMRDSVGRQVTIAYEQVILTPSGAPTQKDIYDEITFPAYNGTNRAVKVHYCLLNPAEAALPADQLACPNYTGPALETYSQLFGLNGSTQTKFNARVVSFVELPDGRRYDFRYNKFGELIRATLPTGGGFGYEWAPGPGTTNNGLVYPSGSNPMIYRRVTKRIVYQTAQLIEGQTTYVATESAAGCAPEPWCTTVEVNQQDAGAVSRQTEKHYFYGSTGNPDTYFDANYFPSAREGREYKVEQWKLGATPSAAALSTEMLWEERACVTSEVCPAAIAQLRASAIDLRVRKTTTSLLETGKSSSQEITSYDRYNNPLVTDESGFNGLYRRISRTYVDSLNGQIYTRPLPSETAPDVNQTVHIRGLVSAETTIDSIGTALAQAAYEYDVHTGTSPRHAPRTGTTAPNRDTLITAFRGNLTQAARTLYVLPPDIPAQRDLLTNFLYDDTGNLVKLVDAKGNETAITYSGTYSFAWPTSVRNAVSHSVQTVYDFNTGYPTSFTDPNTKTVAYNRAGDVLDRLTAVSFPDGGLTEFKYCESGSNQACDAGMTVNTYRKRVKQDSCGTNTVIADGAYDGLGRAIKETQFEAGTNKIIRETQYDFLGRAYRVSNPTRSAAGAEWSETQFDSLGRVVKTLYPDGSATLYEPLGHQLTITDPATKKTQQIKDAFGRLESVTEDPGGPLSATTFYQYSVLDDLVGVCRLPFQGSVCPNGGQRRTFVYDSLRRLASAENPESGKIRYFYDDAGNVTQRIDASSVLVGTTYDAINRPLTRTYPSGTPNVNFTWDTVFKGKLSQVANSNAITDYLAYDNLGRVLTSRQTTNSLPYSFSYQYNLAGGLAQETYPSTRGIATCYDEVGRISQLRQKANATAAATVVATVATYAPHGAVQTLNIGPTGVVSEISQYNERLQPTQITAGTWQSKLYYCPGLAATCSTNSGNILRQEGFGGAAWDYTYDSLNRMQSATERVSNTAQWQQTYRYDAVGNRALINAPVGTTPAFIPYLNSTPVVSSTSEPMPFSDKNRWSLAAYDLAGNQTTAFGDGTGVGSAAYAYDAENRMIRADPQFPTAPSTSGSILYGYDGDGRRVTKSILQTVNNSPVYVLNNVWVYDALGQLAAEYGESPTMPCTTCYVTADHLGSTRVIWDSAGTIKKLTDYAPFGEEIPSAFRGNDSRYPGALYPRTGGQAVPVEFTGKERDAETGLDYFGARYFSSAQGRMTSPDAPFMDQHIMDPQSWNLYTYGRNNPLRYVDPTGQEIELVGDEEARKKALAVLAAGVGKAGSQLQINEVKDGDNTRYVVGVSGSLSDFAKTGSGAADLAAVIGAKPVVEFGVTDKDLPGKGRNEAAYTYAPGEIGNQNVRVLVNPGKVNDASVAFSTNGLLRNKYGSGLLRDLTPTIAAWHELGHAWGMWQDIQARSSGIPGASGIEIGSASQQRALQWENRMRENLYGPIGPNNAGRRQH